MAQDSFEHMQLRHAGPTEVLTAARRLVLHNRWLGTATGLWIIGLLVVFVLPAPVPITPEKMARFEQRMFDVQAAEQQLSEVESDFFTADLAYRSEAVMYIILIIEMSPESMATISSFQGYLPWFASTEQKKVIAQFRERRDTLQQEVTKAQNHLMHKKRRANKQLGLFSSHGIEEAKTRFWASFEKAKVIGRRNTFMDGMFAIVFNRDLELMDMVLRLALYLVVNISCAMFLMFWIFVYRLPSYIWTFGATWYESSLFFILSVIGAASVMMTFCLLVTAAAGGSVYALSRMSGHRARLQGPTSDGRRRLRMDVPGYSATDFGRERYYRANRQPQTFSYSQGAQGQAGAASEQWQNSQHPHTS